MPETSIETALAAFVTYMRKAVIREDSVSSFNRFVYDLTHAGGGRLDIHAPHGRRAQLEMGYVSESYLRMHTARLSA